MGKVGNLTICAFFLGGALAAKGARFEGTPFAEACRGMEIDTGGPALDQSFLDLASASSSKIDFYRRINLSPRHKVLNSSFTLMKRSSSRDKRNTSADYPRVIGFGGTMVLASVDHPHPINAEQGTLVEGIAYASQSLQLAGQDLAAKKLHFFTLDFAETPPRVNLKPQSCQSCHAGRFNWETYNVWPGALPGKRHYTDVVEERDLSPRDLRSRLETMLSPEKREDYFFNEASEILSRGLDAIVPELISNINFYRDPLLSAIARVLHHEGIDFDEKEKSWLETRETERQVGGIYAHLNFKSFDGSNRELNQFINSLTFDKIQYELSLLPSFDSKKYAALAGVLGCGSTPDFVGSSTNIALGGEARFKQLEDEIREQLNLQYETKEKVIKDFGERESINTADLEDVQRLATLRYLFELEGFELGRYSPNFFGRKDKLSYGFAHVGAGTFGANQLMCHLAPELISESPELAKFFSDSKVIDSYRAPNADRPLCQVLKRLSLERTM